MTIDFLGAVGSLEGAWPYGSLFLAAFLAATLLPAQSELLLAGLLASDRYDAALLLAVATAGNVLGSVVNWAIGRFLEHYRDRPWFPVPPQALERAERWYRRYGIWTLLLSWAPVVGDPLTLIAGTMRTGFWRFAALVLLAKGGRYLAVAYATTLATGP